MKHRTLVLLGGVSLAVLAQLSAIGLLLSASWLIVRAAQHPPVLYLMVAIVGVRFFGISRSAFRYGERLLTHDVAFADAVEQRVSTYQDLERIAPRGLDAWRRGSLISRVVDDVSVTQDRLLRVRLNWWTGVAATVIVIAVIAWLSPSAGLVLAGTAFVLAVLVRIVLPTLVSQSLRETSEGRGDLAAEVSATAMAATELVALNATDFATAHAGQAARQLSIGQRAAGWFTGLGSAVVLLGIGAAVVSIAGITRSVDQVLIGVLLLAPMALAEAWDGWVEAERFRPEVEAAEQRLQALADIPEGVIEPQPSAELPNGWALEVHDLVCGWDAPLIQPVSFDVRPGDIVGISAPSGTGKSTLAWTLLRLIEAQSGHVLIGGVDTRSLAAKDVRSRIGFLGQDEVVFDTSIRENLRVGKPDASDAELWTVLDQVHLGEFVRGLPQDLDTHVGEGGNQLSGGERQRLCVARLLLSDHKIWILDEPTEHLDAPTAEALIEDVFALVPEGTESTRSLIVVSHSDEVLAKVDRVIHLHAQPSG